MACDPCGGANGLVRVNKDYVNSRFREAPFNLSENITNLTQMFPAVYDGFNVKQVEHGTSPEYTKLVYKGSHGPVFDDWDAFEPIKTPQAENGDLCPPKTNCSWNPHELDFATEAIKYGLHRIQLATKPYCIDDIKWKFEFKQILKMQLEDMLRQNVNIFDQVIRNNLIKLAKKIVITQTGGTDVNFNTTNDKEWPPIADIEQVGRLNLEYIISYYNEIATIAGPDQAVGMQDGMPIFPICVHPSDWRLAYRLDNNFNEAFLRGEKNSDIYSSYQFLNKVGPFVAKFDPFAWRYELDAATNLPVRVLHVENEICGATGSYSSYSPAYERAPLGVALIATRRPFDVLKEPALNSTDGRNRFGDSMFFDFEWYNERCKTDPTGKWGFYYTEGVLGVEPMGIDLWAFMYRREVRDAFVESITSPTCLQPITVCGAAIDSGCPMPSILDCCKAAGIAGREDTTLAFKFDSDAVTFYGLSASDPVSVKTVNGVFTGQFDGATSNGKILNISFDPADFADVQCCPDTFIGLVTAVDTVCTANIVSAETCTVGGVDMFHIFLDQPIACSSDTNPIKIKTTDCEFIDMVLVGDAIGGTELYVNYAVAPDPDCGVNCVNFVSACCGTAQAGCPECEDVEPVCTP